MRKTQHYTVYANTLILKTEKKIRGNYTTIATVLKEGSKLAPLSAHSRAHNTSEKVELANGVSLRKYQELAKKPQEWQKLTKEITIAARKQWITADSNRMDRYNSSKETMDNSRQ